MNDRDGHYMDALETSIRGWVQEEHPDDVELARRAGHLAAELAQRGVELADVCRAVFAYVADDAGRPPAPEDDARPGTTTARP